MTARDTVAGAFRLAWPAALLVLGSLLLSSAWGRWQITLAIAAAAALPLLLLRLVIRLGVSRWAASTVLLMLLLLLGYLLTAGADLSFSETVRDAVPRLLSSPRPYAVRADLVVGPLLLTALVSLFVGLRVESSHRVEPVIGAALLYVAGALLTAGRADPWGLVAVLLLVVALLGWVFLDEHSEPVRQRFAIAAPLSVIGVGALTALATLTVAEPFEPRDLVDPPIIQVSSSNPLTHLGAWSQNPDVELLRVRGARVPLRLVTLDAYDGRQWTAATRFAPLGTGAETPLPPGDVTREATVEVELDRLGGNWLPTPGQPTELSDPDAVVDPDTGTVYLPGDTDGLSYEVTGHVDAPPAAALAAGTVPQAPETPAISRYTELPDRLPTRLQEYCRRIALDATTPYEQALAIEEEIRSSNKLSDEAISGSALWRIEAFLVGSKGESGARVGSSEQFASAFALVARFKGLPTRVVVGFRPGEEQDDGSRLVTGADAFAWPEVYFDGLGWVPFSPTPDDDTFRHARPEQPDDPTFTQSATPSPQGGSASDSPSPSPAAAPEDAGDRGDGAAPAWRPYVLVGGAVAGGVLLMAGARWVRRARHRRRGAPGAWAEVLDALRLAGHPIAGHQTADQIAESLDRRLGTSATARVAELAERASFGPGPLAPAYPPEVRDVRRGVRRSVPWWRRWWWHLDPRVLGR